MNRQSAAVVGYEARLWDMANTLRGSIDASEYKHIVLGLLFLKYTSDAFAAARARIESEVDDGADPENRDEYAALSVFWVPQEARWDQLQANAAQPDIGRRIDDAMYAVERDNPRLNGVLPKEFARLAVDDNRLGRLIASISDIQADGGESSLDALGRVYEYFLNQFASAEGRQGGEFYTPRCVVQLLVEMLQPYYGRVYDPCCGSAGMFVQSIEFILAHRNRNGNGGNPKFNLSIYGQESNQTTWRLAQMNLAIRAIWGQVEHGDTFHNDRFPDMRADYILANPPFNVRDWGGDRLADDIRWRYGQPPAGNANFAWVQHIVHHLAPGGVAGFVLANGSMSSTQRQEAAIRRAIVDADLVDCMVALPGQLFYSTQIPACLWFLANDRADGKYRDRRGETLFIDARGLGRLVDRTHRELEAADIARVAAAYHAWRGDEGAGAYADIPGFCKSVPTADTRRYDYALTPGRYVGAAPSEADDAAFEDRMRRLSDEWRAQQADSQRLDAAISHGLARLGFGAGDDE